MFVKEIKILITVLFFIATVQAQCNINQNNGLVFACTPNDFQNCSAIGNIGLFCSDLTTMTLTLSQGSANQFYPRQLKDAIKGHAVPYNVFLDASKTQTFGDGTQGTNVLTVSCNGSCNYNIYGFILSNTVKAGTYSDSPTLTINY